jgi:ferredoxin-NADP reductase
MSRIIQTRCEHTHAEAGGVKVFTLRADGADTGFLDALQPGGHVAIRYPDFSGTPRQRLYSITRMNEPDLFEIAVKRTGRRGVSDYLHSTVKEGSIIPLQYAASTVTVASISNFHRVVMLAGGIGITLPIALIREFASLSRSGKHVPAVTLLLCFPRVADIPFLHELLELGLTTEWFTFRVFVTREDIQACTHFQPGRPSDHFLEALQQPDAVVICGSHTFAHQFRQRVANWFPRARLFAESFTPPTSPSEPPGAPLTSARLLLAETGLVIEADTNKNILDNLETNHISIRSQCRSGICGSCRLRIVSGNCRFEPDFCLSDGDRANGYALACCTFPKSGDVTIALHASR